MAQQEMPMEQDDVQNLVINSQGIPEYTPIVVPPPLESVATFDSNGPRLMITHIVNEYFKSYAGTQTLGPFHKNFSSIVGPNGSGKSNVIDSMLFVFGYRANKIRSKKLSVLIHNSEQHKNINSCTVSVYFQKIIDTGDGENDYDVVPGSKFAVSRTAFRDNSSYYKINDKKATYKEVAVLLRASGIDLDHNRFLILQGEVEQIAMMKPKAMTEHDEGMLEFLEDIIGSSRFKEPIEILAKRVEELNDFRAEKLNRVKAVEKEKNDLEGVKNEAVEYLCMENDIVKKKNMLYQKYISEFNEHQEKATVKYNEIKEGMKEMTEKQDKINEFKRKKVKEHKDMYKEYEKLSAECETKKEEFAKFEQQDVRCREDLKHTKAKVKKFDKQLAQERQKLEELNQIPEKTEKDVVSLKQKLEKLESEKAKEEEKLKVVMESLKTETQGLQEEKDKKEEELLALQKNVNEAKSKMTVSQSELDIYISSLHREEAKLRESKTNLERVSATLKDRRNAIKDVEKRLPETQNKLEKTKIDLNKAIEDEAKLTEKVRISRVRVEEARSSLQAAKSSGKVIDTLLEQKRNGKLPGIFGRLGNLGGIDEKYDVAISTACGALDNIVVDSINTAQKCVEFLKRNNVGTATFIALDKMDRWKQYCYKKIETPENVPRLYDLVKVQDERVLPAFYFALRDTLVGDNLDQATRIAYGRVRYRVVTLQGQLIDTSGTMSGGGGRVSKGRMSSKIALEVDPKQLTEWENQLKRDTTEIESLHKNKVMLEETVDKLQRQYNELKYAMEKFSMDIQSLNEQEKSLKRQVEEQEQRVKDAAPDEKELKQLEKTVEANRKEYKKASEKASVLEEEVHVLHKQIMEIGGSKLKSAESRVNFVSTQIDQIIGHITKASVAVKNAQRNAKKTEDKVNSLQEEQKENEEKIKILEAEFKTLEEDATGVLQAYQTAQDKMKEVEETLEELKDELAKVAAEEQELEKENIEVKHELEKYEGVIKENQQKIKFWKKQLSKLSLHKIEEHADEQFEQFEVEKLHDVDKEGVQYEITVLEEKLAQMKPNMAAIAEYKRKEEMYLKRVGELDAITDMRDEQRQLHDNLRKQRLDEFMTGFGIITNKLKEMYQMITLGGDAELELVDSLDPFSEGIVFSVRPPKKSWKNISNLSGGEKTLSSLALVFALHHYKPTPLYVMDEIDAALDFKNVSIVANYIKERTKNAQFIIISLRNNMFELADRLIGIYKTYNCTKSVTINPGKISILLPSVTESASSVAVTATAVTATAAVLNKSPVSQPAAT